jgi:hypothetical protein
MLKQASEVCVDLFFLSSEWMELWSVTTSLGCELHAFVARLTVNMRDFFQFLQMCSVLVILISNAFC